MSVTVLSLLVWEDSWSFDESSWWCEMCGVLTVGPVIGWALVAAPSCRWGVSVRAT
jgi:hypothetical protein